MQSVAPSPTPTTPCATSARTSDSVTERGCVPAGGGDDVTMKTPSLTAVPVLVTIEIGADVAPAGTTTTTLVSLADDTTASMSPKRTTIGSARPTPVTVTDVPTVPVPGENP